MHWLTERPGFTHLKAARNDRLFIADGNRFFNRPGPRVVETLGMIRQMIDGIRDCCAPETWAVYSKEFRRLK
jgi:ABC-type hemin transport system substrate-binding protein